MNSLRILLVGIAVFYSFSGWCEDGLSSAIDEDRTSAQLRSDGTRLIQSGKPNEAIDYFDKLIARYEARFNDGKTQYFSTRSQAESLIYLLDFSNRKTVDGKSTAKVVSSDWAYAYYLKAYALVETGRLSEAKPSLERALALSPRNSQFLSELGHIYQLEKNWQLAMQTFQLAEAAAKETSPPKVKDTDLSRAWRGLGYTLTELNRLDEAEKMYRQCLELDKNDAKALNELGYIQDLKARHGGR
jgi:tetratricopeptide (TPR) repeat protein